MTISIKSPTSTTGSIQLNASDVLTIESDRSVDIDSGTLHVDATNNRVGIGTSSPTNNLQIYNNGATSGQIHITNSSTGATATDGVLFGYDGSNDVLINNQEATAMKFYNNGAERMRIDSGGKILMGRTSPLSSGKVQTYANSGYAHQMYYDYSSGTGYFIEFLRTTGTFGSVAAVVGTISASTTTTTYATSSDYRLKENVIPMSGGIDRLKQLKPSTWSWTQDGSHGEGFLAHEAQAVVPEAVTGTKDAVDDEGNPVYQGIDQSKLVPLLTSALQEAITKIEALEARVATLEGN